MPTYANSKNPNQTQAYIGIKPKELTFVQKYFQSFQQVQDPSLRQTQFTPQGLHNQVPQGFVVKPHHTQQVNVSLTQPIYQP